MRRFILVAAALLFAAPALSQYPHKPIRMVVPLGPGTSTDIITRIIAQPLSQALGQPIVVETKPGADGAIGAMDVLKAAPDGYTLLLGTNSPLSSVPHLRKTPPYDPVTDFTPIGFVGNFTFFIVVHPGVPAKSVAELISYARANPGKLNYATGNTTAIVSTAVFANLANISIQHIPYKAEPPAIIDLLSGQIHLMFSSYSTVAPHIRDGKLRALVTTLPQRSPLLPEVPSIVEAGFPKYTIVPWAGMVGPAKMPKEIVDRLNRELNAVLARPEIRESLAKQAFAGRGSSTEEMATLIREQIGVWGKAIRDAGIQPE